MNATNSSSALNGAGAADLELFDIVAIECGGAGIGGGIVPDLFVLDFGSGIGVGVRGWLGSAGVPITFRTGSGSSSPA